MAVWNQTEKHMQINFLAWKHERMGEAFQMHVGYFIFLLVNTKTFFTN